MVYLIVGIALAAALAGLLGWRLYAALRALDEARARLRGLQKDRAIRQNLQHILEGREAELRRLRARLRQYEAEAQEMESRASELNLTLFRESGLRILAEKEEGAKRMKMDLMERQLEENGRRLRAARAEAQEAEAKLREVIAQQQAEIDRLTAALQPRRAPRRAAASGGLDQVTLDDILSGGRS